MNFIKLENAGRKYFTVRNVSEILNISEASARVLCSRYVKKGILTRLKKNFYVLNIQINNLSKEDLFKISNLLITPSYVSFMTALSYFEVTTQLYREVIESVSLIKTEEFAENDPGFIYRKIKPDLFFGFEKINDFFIATKEKALLDCLYFSSLNRYAFDESSIDLSKFSRESILKLSKKYPLKTQKLLKTLYERI